MLNRALPPKRVPGAVAALLSIAAFPCLAQENGAPASGSATMSARDLVLPSAAKIEGVSSSGETLAILRGDDGSWTGVLGLGGRVWAAGEDDCPAFTDALNSFQGLPPLYPGPSDLRHRGATLPMGPSAPHARAWRLTLIAYAPDGSSVEMNLEGRQGPYPAWASATSDALKTCGAEVP